MLHQYWLEFEFEWVEFGKFLKTIAAGLRRAFASPHMIGVV
jgi:hypothetical protein